MRHSLTPLLLPPIATLILAWGFFTLNRGTHDIEFAWFAIIGTLLFGTTAIATWTWTMEERIAELEEKLKKLTEKSPPGNDAPRA